MINAAILGAHRAQAILGFWFGEPGSLESTGPRAVWFKRDAAHDAAIRRRHFGDYEKARDGGYDDWQLSAPLSLALVIALDQFPRNLFRGDARAFATDAKALAVAQGAIARGFDRAALPHQRVFYYLPFEHSEDISMQRRCLALIESMPEITARAGYYDYAMRHFEIIKRFGRFPHRNVVLGRESTPEELEFLQQPGATF